MKKSVCSLILMALTALCCYSCSSSEFSEFDEGKVDYEVLASYLTKAESTTFIKVDACRYIIEDGKWIRTTADQWVGGSFGLSGQLVFYNGSIYVPFQFRYPHGEEYADIISKLNTDGYKTPKFYLRKETALLGNNRMKIENLNYRIIAAESSHLKLAIFSADNPGVSSGEYRHLDEFVIDNPVSPKDPEISFFTSENALKSYILDLAAEKYGNSVTINGETYYIELMRVNLSE